MNRGIKNFILAPLCLILIGTPMFYQQPIAAADNESSETFEYATIRWAGRENTHVIRPSGNVEFIGTQLTKVKKPDRADDRSFYMNIALNALAKEGYELVAMTPDDYILKRRRR